MKYTFKNILFLACADFKTINNGNFYPSKPKISGKFYAGVEVVFYCDEGYQLNNVNLKTNRCLRSRKWKNNFPVCLRGNENKIFLSKSNSV